MRRLIWFALLVILGAGVVFYYEDEISDLLQRGRRAAFGPSAKEGPSIAPTVKITLYFASAEEDLLLPYEAEIEKGKDNVATLKNLIAALVAGPQREGYAPIVPKGTKLRVAFPGPNATAYIDFDPTLRNAHPGGAWAEMLTAYGVANTVIKNFPKAFDRVVLLIGGQQARSVAGTVPITGPLRLREDLISKKVPVASEKKKEKGKEAPEKKAVKEKAPVPAAKTGTKTTLTPPRAAGEPAEKLPPVGTAPVGPVGVPRKEEKLPAVGSPSGRP